MNERRLEDELRDLRADIRRKLRSEFDLMIKEKPLSSSMEFGIRLGTTAAYSDCIVRLNDILLKGLRDAEV